MSRLIGLDLHTHTALSPCGAREMSPPAVLLTAERMGVRVLGVVDHSTAGNAEAFLQAAPAFALRVLVGLEIESAEGVHLLALFDNAEAAQAMDELVARHLPLACNRPDVLGCQWLLDAWGEIVGTEERLLVNACSLTVEQVAEETIARGGLSVAAHVDRMANGLLPTLGFIPPRLRVDLIEVSPHLSVAAARRRWPELCGRAVLTGSDAHYLHDIGRAATRLPQELAAPTAPLREWGARLAQFLAATGGEEGA